MHNFVDSRSSSFACFGSAILFLGGCNVPATNSRDEPVEQRAARPNKSGAGYQSQVLPEPELPKIVSRLLDKNPPADGSFRVSKRDQLRIGPNTIVCIFQPKSEFDVPGVNVPSWANADALRSSLARAKGLRLADNSERIRYWRHGNCQGQRPIFVRPLTLPNRSGGPYRLVVAAWQGDQAIWIGSVERIAEPGRVATWGLMYPTHPPSGSIAQSITFAGNQLFEKFVKDGIAF